MFLKIFFSTSLNGADWLVMMSKEIDDPPPFQQMLMIREKVKEKNWSNSKSQVISSHVKTKLTNSRDGRGSFYTSITFERSPAGSVNSGPDFFLIDYLINQCMM